MAKRFGGKYSPDGSHGASPTPADTGYARAQLNPVGARANVMFIPAIPLVALALNDGALGLAMALVAAAVLTLAAWLLREGIKAQAAFDERKVARRPALPRKMLAAALAGLGIAMAAYKNDGQILAAILFGVITCALHLAAFGIDPMRDKGMEGVDTFQQDRVARVVDEAEAYLTAMSDALKRSGDRQMERHLSAFQSTARDLIRTVEEDPRDLTAARKYLGVYLMGARDATAKYADIYSRTQDAKAREEYASLLNDLTQNFAARTRKMLVDDRSDLTVEIEVLRDRLGREGVRLAPQEEIEKEAPNV